ncbi:AAA family ATPase [bacterium]|nr:AAA family ATPase [bacterium]
MITKFQIKNFKSLAGFSLPPDKDRLGPMVCLVGLNGAGKSTVLQALDFVAHLVTGQPLAWLAKRRWVRDGFVSAFSGVRSNTIEIHIELELPDDVVVWDARYDCDQHRCQKEELVCKSTGDKYLEVEGGTLSVKSVEGEGSKHNYKIPFEYGGSVISQLKTSEIHPIIGDFRTVFTRLRALELLSPSILRSRARGDEQIGYGGENLSVFLESLSDDQREELTQRLQGFYPTMDSWDIETSAAGGWKGIQLQEHYPNEARIGAEHINDGFLRVIAILSQAYTEDRFVLIDEIENGMNPEIVEKLMDFLVELGKQGKQVIVTTHSPLILNYLEDEVAEKAVYLLYRNNLGHTKAVRYFSFPQTRRKLEALGPGEVYADTPVSDLVDSLVREDSEGYGE